MSVGKSDLGPTSEGLFEVLNLDTGPDHGMSESSREGIFSGRY